MTTEKLLVETLNQLSPEDFDKFKSLTGEHGGEPIIRRSQLKAANTQDVVELMVETYRRECVEATTKVLMKMSRTDLVQRLSEISKVHWPHVQRLAWISY
uniref:Pyrin domain-containing protein n=1 Tax=Stegastes partitus TaxID=144197 RepID=A0A3B4YZS0_9TELE